MRKLFHWNKKVVGSLIVLGLIVGSAKIILAAPRDVERPPCGTQTIGGTITECGCCCDLDYIRSVICRININVQLLLRCCASVNSKLDHIQISISDYYESIESKLDKLIPITETIESRVEIIEDCCGTVNSKIGDLDDTIGEEAYYLSTLDLVNDQEYTLVQWLKAIYLQLNNSGN